MSAKGRIEVSYRWNLRMLMASRGMFSTSALVPLLAERGVPLSREQVYRLVAKVPERLSLTTLAALCDILECSPADLIEPVREAKVKKATPFGAEARDILPRRARVAPRSNR
ncbi:MAG: helix-turn-helix transcriptional regulator [Actinomycetota bacterium]|nr:helix-turn-helix transcriptional regulator [Actinomycetota bacterium]